ncbi:MAG: tRNA pseudouridine(55) synthase TruB [Anaerolineaceae bacterium]|jgi:tRNA pseudouridine55 synthase|nr:MAG: tRNA pseudouridine(55) synthase TruB [Anaerolineaceae bacterium]
MDDRRTQLKNTVSGVLVVDKPIGITSHDVVQIIRNGTRIKRAGHTGTLDPRASGVLVILLGPAVRLSEYVSAEDKRYHAVIQLGKKTDTFDEEGSITGTAPVDITAEQFEEALKGFIGEIEQVPPPYSAVKVNGRKAYELAREGEEVDLEPRIIHVHNLELLEWDPPQALVDVHCSSGTYVRSLANDLGEVLGCGAMLAGLRRTKSGKFTLNDAIPLRKLSEAFQDGTWYKYLIPAADALGEWPTINLTAEEVELVQHGHRIRREEKIGDMARAITEQGELVALMQFDEESGEYQPKKVFFS